MAFTRSISIGRVDKRQRIHRNASTTIGGCADAYPPYRSIYSRSIFSMFTGSLAPQSGVYHPVTSFEIRGTLSHDQAWVPDGAHGRS